MLVEQPRVAGRVFWLIDLDWRLGRPPLSRRDFRPSMNRVTEFCTEPYIPARPLLYLAAMKKVTSTEHVDSLSEEQLAAFRKALRADIHRIRRSTVRTKSLLQNSSLRVEDDQPEPAKHIVNKPR